jgi:pimeloyl-ACP methyl ester carboxylesterase
MKEVRKESGTFKSFDGTEIYYESRGEGTPIVLIYGIACQMNHWHHQMVYFSQRHRVITLDIRGHHKSQTPLAKGSLTIGAVAKDVVALMDHLKVPAAHLAGHSFGVPILIELNALSPERVLSNSFVNGFAKNPIKGMFGLNLAEPLYQFIKQQHDKAPELISEIWKVAVNNPVSMFFMALAGGFNFHLTQLKDMEIYTKGVSLISLDVFLPMFEDLMNFNGTSLLKKISAPTLILSGEKDAVTPFSFQEEMHSLVKNSSLVVVPYGSHCTQLDYPDYVNLKLESHFERAEKEAAQG